MPGQAVTRDTSTGRTGAMAAPDPRGATAAGGGLTESLFSPQPSSGSGKTMPCLVLPRSSSRKEVTSSSFLFSRFSSSFLAPV